MLLGRSLCFEGNARSAIITSFEALRSTMLCFEGNARSAIIAR